MLLFVALICLAAPVAAGKLPAHVPKEYLGVPSDDMDWFPVAGTRTNPNMRVRHSSVEQNVRLLTPFATRDIETK